VGDEDRREVATRENKIAKLQEPQLRKAMDYRGPASGNSPLHPKGSLVSALKDTR
jgi:hypothetical protein